MKDQDMRSALLAAVRVATALSHLEQSQRPADISQAAAGVRHEIRTIQRCLEAAVELDMAVTEAVVNLPGQVRSDAPATSRAAAQHVSVRSGSQRGRVLMYLRRSSTDYEIQQALNLAPSSERPRRGELVAQGLVTPTDLTKDHNGEQWTIWTLTQLGRYVADRLAGGENTVPLNTIVPEALSTPDDADTEPALF